MTCFLSPCVPRERFGYANGVLASSQGFAAEGRLPWETVA